MVKLFSETNLSPRLETLRSVSLFADLKAKELRIVDGLLHERSYVADEVVFDEGEDGQALYVVFSGEVLIVHPTDGGDGLVATVKSGEFFGFFNMLGRFSSVLGPTLIAVTSLISTSPRLSLVSLLLLFATGGYLLSRVPFPEEHK